MKQLELLARQKGVYFVYCHRVIGDEPLENRDKVRHMGPDERTESLKCKWFINSAGFGASKVAEILGIDIDKAGYRVHLCKGEYFILPYARSHLIKHLVYPPPHDSKKGEKWGHITKSLDGRVRLGPSAFYVDSIDYSFEER